MAVDERPVTRYARAPDGVSIAYQVTGDGPLDLMITSEGLIPIDLLWEDPSFVRFAKRLGSFSRTVWCEARSVGSSGGDTKGHFGASESDMTTVLDTVGCERVGLIGFGSSGATTIEYAANHAERVTALILINSFAHYVREDDYPIGHPPENLDLFEASVRESWGTEASIEVLAPSKAGDDAFRTWFSRAERLSASPENFALTARAASLRDVRQLLPALTIPALVLHRSGNGFIRVEAGQYLAARIPGARYVELPGDDYLFFVGDTDALLDEVEEFLTGSRTV